MTVSSSIPSNFIVSLAMYSLFLQTAAEEKLSKKANVSCIMTADECQCSVFKPSGICMHLQEEKFCLIENCSEGYRCDCLGYEMCKRISCSKYTTAANVIPSETKPFKCQLTPNATICIDFASYADTVSSAQNAYTESSLSTDECFEEERKIATYSNNIKNAKVVVHDTLKKLEQYFHQIPKEQRSELEKDSRLIMDSAHKVNTEAMISSEKSAEAFKANQKVLKFKNEAQIAEKQAIEKSIEYMKESDKPENKDTCIACEHLKAEIKAMRVVRKEAAISAGMWAKKCRDHGKNSNESRRKVEKIGLTVAEAHARFIVRSQRLLGMFHAFR